MWALCRASDPLRRQFLGLGTVRAFGVGSEIACLSPLQLLPDRCSASTRFYNADAHRGLSSQTTAECGGDNEPKALPEMAAHSGTINWSNVEDRMEELIPAQKLTSQDKLELSGADADPSEEKRLRKTDVALFKTIVSSPRQSVKQIFSSWVKEGKRLERDEVSSAIQKLRKLQFYGKALQLWECLEETKSFNFIEQDYASRLNLIARVHGLKKAEDYINKIPESIRKQMVYQTLLSCYVSADEVKKAEKIFNKMRDWGFPLSTFACDQLLLLYKRTGRNKIASVLSLMERENVKLSERSYTILIDAKGRSRDREGMEKVVMTMNKDGIEPSIDTKAILAKHYASFGLKERAKGLLLQIEGGNLKNNRWVCKYLLPIYAMIGEAEEVKRVWKIFEMNPFHDVATAAIEAWGKLNRVEEAEEVLMAMSKAGKRPSPGQYNALLRVYAGEKMLRRGKHLVKRMSDEGIPIGPSTWDALVRLYVKVGELEKANSILQKAAASQKKNEVKPQFISYMFLMEQFAKRGDVLNTEKLFQRMRELGYIVTMRHYQTVIEAYSNLESPPYGIRERMKADKLFPNRHMEGRLAKIEPFRKSQILDLLE